MWWRADSAGYTDYVSRAGRYTFDDAISICNEANFDWNLDDRKKIPEELPILEAIALKLKNSQNQQEVTNETTN